MRRRVGGGRLMRGRRFERWKVRGPEGKVAGRVDLLGRLRTGEVI